MNTFNIEMRMKSGDWTPAYYPITTYYMEPYAGDSMREAVETVKVIKNLWNNRTDAPIEYRIVVEEVEECE